MPAFDRLNRIAGKAVDRLHGERILISPRAEGSQYGGRVPDTTRVAHETRGVFADEPGVNDIAGQRAGNSLPGVTRLTNGQVSIQILAAFAELMPWEPRKGDLVQLIERAGSPFYSIVDPQKLDFGDRFLVLVREPQ
ncbi:hypothetical protein [Mesorhizobium sp. M2A.F.Ca.ET.039.01.1.1]|uniref:hypothetical protein n=1 Tax=Mesorhizobium sp. M2A.F.Ca.ET.039.01.1.1 TaxID=2496746 RepID=UPI000FCA7153|nr:hypothetical protein [Mesorhizobium sp. M2A.F.Ca.ET.039.01.1.1]RWX72586.1 hypothetical protein EOA24_00920 [Mesorhizobium sp. M2A.F.Ca.ET.039.01.1.1]